MVGSINVDLVVRVPKLPAAGETVSGGSFAQHYGGKGANQAVAAARLGAAVTFVGAVGADELGRAARDGLADEGVGVRGLSARYGTPTGVALIVVDDSGENQIAVAPGANASVDASAVEATLGGDGALEPGGVFLANFEIGDEAIIAGARLASEAGMTLVINPAPARPIPSELLSLRPILVPNEQEAKSLTGEADTEAAAWVLGGRTSAPVVITLGSGGVLVLAEGRVDTIAAPVVEVVDTTGAGDTFCGALAAELATGIAINEAVQLAIRAASLSVTVAGARGGMPTRAQLESGEN